MYLLLPGTSYRQTKHVFCPELPKQHSMWAPVGPQLGPKWAPDGPDWGPFGNAAWVYFLPTAW